MTNKLKEIKFPVLVFILWRGILEILVLAAERLLPAREGYLGPSPWANFDGIHYLSIAERDYGQYEHAFFPLFPMLIRWLGHLFGDNFLLAGLLISHFSFFGALVIFWKLLENLRFSDRGKLYESQKRWALLFLAFFPTSFYFASVYTESLFLLLLVFAFSRLQNITRGQISAITKFCQLVLYGLAASLASATKLVGVFLMVPGGLFLYMADLYKRTGDPIWFIKTQPAFGAGRSGGEIILLPQVFWRYLKIMTNVPLNSYDFWLAFIEVIFFFGALTLLWRAWKMKLPRFWILFSMTAIIGPTLTGSLSSMPRYVLMAFPIFIAMATINRKWRHLFFVLCCLFFVLFTILFTRGYWVS